MRAGIQPRPSSLDPIRALGLCNILRTLLCAPFHASICAFTLFFLCYLSQTGVAPGAGIGRSFAQQRAAERGVVLQPPRQSLTKALRRQR